MEGCIAKLVAQFFLAFQADQSGTITEVLVDDGKPVSVDTVISLYRPLRNA